MDRQSASLGAGGVKVALIASSPHCGGAFVIMRDRQLGGHQPIAKQLIARKHSAAFIKRRAVCQPAFNGIRFTRRHTLKRGPQGRLSAVR